MFRRGPCKLFGQQLDEVSLRLGIAPSPIKLHVIGIDRWLCDVHALSARRAVRRAAYGAATSALS